MKHKLPPEKKNALLKIPVEVNCSSKLHFMQNGESSNKILISVKFLSEKIQKIGLYQLMLYLESHNKCPFCKAISYTY